MPDVKKVKIRRTLLCSDGPKGGYPVGMEFEAPFPPGIARELKLDRKRIDMGLGALEIVRDKPARVTVNTQSPLKVTATETKEGIDIVVVDPREVLFRKFDRPKSFKVVMPAQQRSSKRAKPWLSEYPKKDADRIRDLLRKRFDFSQPAAAGSTEPAETPSDSSSLAYVRPRCLDGDKVPASKLTETKRRLRDYAAKALGAKVDARQSIDKMIAEVLSLEKADDRE